MTYHPVPVAHLAVLPLEYRDPYLEPLLDRVSEERICDDFRVVAQTTTARTTSVHTTVKQI